MIKALIFSVLLAGSHSAFAAEQIACHSGDISGVDAFFKLNPDKSEALLTLDFRGGYQDIQRVYRLDKIEQRRSLIIGRSSDHQDLSFSINNTRGKVTFELFGEYATAYFQCY